LAGPGTTLAGLGLLRVYVKRAEDYPVVRAACEGRLGKLPVTYVVADVCRPDLLVEMEGVGFFPLARPVQVSSGEWCQGGEGAPAAAGGGGQATKPRGSTAPGFPNCPANCPERSWCPEAFFEGESENGKKGDAA
jgi:hypothetical protein